MGSDAANLRLKAAEAEGVAQDGDDDEGGSDPSTGRSHNNDQLVDSGLEPSPRREKPSDKGKDAAGFMDAARRWAQACTLTAWPALQMPPPRTAALRAGSTATAACPGCAGGSESGQVRRGKRKRRRCPSPERCSLVCGSKSLCDAIGELRATSQVGCLQLRVCACAGTTWSGASSMSCSS